MCAILLVIDSLRYSLMEEISLFVSICWPSSRTRIPYFGKRGVTLGEDMEKITLKDSPIEEEKPKIDIQGEVQEVEVEPTQPLPKNWRFASNHPMDLIIGAVSKG